jgi:hypothetical protein
MELALNLAWLFLGLPVCALVLCRLSGRCESVRSNSRISHFIVAIALCWVILFFVISMTDDLNEQQAIFEDGQSSQFPRIASDVADGKCYVAHDLSHAVLDIDVYSFRCSSIGIHHIEPAPLFHASFSQGAPLPDRAPPPRDLA